MFWFHDRNSKENKGKNLHFVTILYRLESINALGSGSEAEYTIVLVNIFSLGGATNEFQLFPLGGVNIQNLSTLVTKVTARWRPYTNEFKMCPLDGHVSRSLTSPNVHSQPAVPEESNTQLRFLKIKIIKAGFFMVWYCSIFNQQIDSSFGI